MPASINRVVFLCGLTAFAAAAEGCQRKPTVDLAPVEGTVTKGGRPLGNVEVTFLADLDAGTQGPKASSFTDEAGHYRLRNDIGGDGAIAGKHRVLVVELKAPMRPRGGAASGPQSKQAAPLLPEEAKRPQGQQVPSRYGSFKETPLRVEVRPGPQTLDFDIP